MIPENQEMGLGGLSSLLGSKSSLASVGSKLLGVSNTSEDILLGIINSRNALTNVIKKFRLMQYYKISDNNMDKALKAFSGDISADPNEYGMIDFSVINEDPRVSAEIANYLVELVDSLNIKFNIEKAKNNREFIEKRYNKNVKDLRNAEDSLYKFQKKYGIVAVPEQLEVTVKAAAEVESELTQKEMTAYFMLQQYGKDSPQYKGIEAVINMLRKKVQELKDSKNLTSSSNVLFPFKEMPDIAIQYLRAYREVEIQQEILGVVLPMYEQAKVDEQKSAPTVLVVDKAVPPELKYRPKKAFIILGIEFLVFFILVVFVYHGEKIINEKEYRNPLVEKEGRFYHKIINFYKMKL
jgi:capsule polysaccharide export protein KpsE/RkpR